MGLTCSELQHACREECDKERRCYVDQNEMKFAPPCPEFKPYVSQMQTSGQRNYFSPSSRSTAATSSYSLQTGHRLSPQSVSWADGLGKRPGVPIGRVQLTPKATSFPHRPSASLQSAKAHLGSSWHCTIAATLLTYLMKAPHLFTKCRQSFRYFYTLHSSAPDLLRQSPRLAKISNKSLPLQSSFTCEQRQVTWTDSPYSDRNLHIVMHFQPCSVKTEAPRITVEPGLKDWAPLAPK
ncbi:Hypothetical protein SCF082_LOCUS37599 [Durusdinium trenchii]|uniref:Uncharacterized protein n=1 Tax=Durusdinium trenchii TaxID=1381693 RepID=A0ABP0PRP9_9DINO